MKKEIKVERILEVEFVETKNKHANLCYARWKDYPINILVFLTRKDPDLFALDTFRNPLAVKGHFELFYANLPEIGDWTPVFVNPEFVEKYKENSGLVDGMDDLVYNDFKFGDTCNEDAVLVFVENNSLVVLSHECEPLTQKVKSFFSEEVHDIPQIKKDILNQKIHVDVDWTPFDMIGMGNCYNYEVTMNKNDYLNYVLGDDISILNKYIEATPYE